MFSSLFDSEKISSKGGTFAFLFGTKCRQDVNVEKCRVGWQGYLGKGLHLPSSSFAPPVRHSAVTHTLYLELQHAHTFVFKFDCIYFTKKKNIS